MKMMTGDMIRRFFDVAASGLALLVLSPILLLTGLFVVATSPGGMFYISKRVGYKGKLFSIYKFRSMRTGADQKGSLNVSFSDNRITPVGRFIRATKLDELPQFFNVFIGDMAFVGPRPDLPVLVDKILEAEKEIILSVRPGLADWASIFAFSQYKVLSKVENIDEYQQRYFQPIKTALQVHYCKTRTTMRDIRIVLTTALAMIGVKLPLPNDVRSVINRFENPFETKIETSTSIAGES